MTNLDMNVVRRFWIDFHKKVESRPFLFIDKNQSGKFGAGRRVTVTLPEDLIEWSNAAAGHSGFGAGARPVGIRIKSDNPRKDRDAIFATPESLAAFIRSSECDGVDHVKKIRLRAKNPVGLNKAYEIPADSNAAVIWGNTIFIDLAKKYGKDTVLNARKYLTVNEFAARFGLDVAA